MHIVGRDNGFMAIPTNLYRCTYCVLSAVELRFFLFIGWYGIRENKDKHATEVKRLIDDKGRTFQQVN